MIKPPRRSFLKGLAASALMPGLAHAGEAIFPRPRAVETIVIIGAGVAGLALARRLKETGRRVVVLEARGELGGRVRTVRAPFDDGLYGELGAARVFDTHFYVQHWVNALGLNLVPFSPSGTSLFAVGGKILPADDPATGVTLFPDLRADERGLTPAALIRKYLEGLPADLSKPETNDASFVGWAPFDRVTWPEWLRQRGASESAVKLMTLGADSRTISALYVLRQIMMHRNGRQYLKIEGGMDRLPRALARDLVGDIRYNCEVTRIETSGDGVRIHVRQGDRSEIVTGHRVAITLPFSVLRGIDFMPQLSPGTREIVATLPYRPVTRFLLQTGNRFWQGRGLSGAARTDAPSELWDASAGQLSARGLLSITAGGTPDVQARLAGMAPAARVKLGTTIAAAAFPELGMRVQKGITQNWGEDPWARGGFAVSYPGQMTRWGARLGRSEGRLHFAGEHVSPWPGWMEGALWSADKVFNDILG